MSTLLHLDSSPMGDYSVSRHLTKTFVEHWTKANPEGTVITRDVTTPVLPPVTAAWVGAAYTPEDKRSAEQKALLTLSDELVGDLKTANEYVIGVPMWNFGVPSMLKAWIDQIARVNVTFSYATGAPVGLLTGKKATVLIAAGGNYGRGHGDRGVEFCGAVSEDGAGVPGRVGCDVPYGGRSWSTELRSGPCDVPEAA
jgi:FMN-dependent NADH-azoreductase